VEFEGTETQQAVTAAARKFATERAAPAAAEADRKARFPEEMIRELGALGLLAVNVPAAHGGSEAGAVAYALAVMEIARADCSLAVTMAVTNMVGETIARFGTEAQKARCLPRLASAEWLAGSYGLSEPQAGSDPNSMSTRADRRGDGWVLNGTKQWITSGDRAGVVIVWARSDVAAGKKGITAFLVEGGTPGMHVGRHEEKMGIRSSSTVSLTFEDCAIPADAVLGQEGHGLRVALTALDGGRIGIASQATGTIRAALDAASRYARDRNAFGKPIAGFQAISFALADMATAHDAARLMTLRAAMLKEAGEPFGREAAMAKLLASESAQVAVSKAVQIHGGYGYIDEFPVERLFRDARVQTIYEGTSEIQRLVIARDILFRDG
jgi:alkylation response protein AidB-like acyl-CoA dehydrogenase